MAEARGYWIARIDVHDEEGYAAYIAAAREAFVKFGARFVVRGGAFEVGDGEARERNVVIEFPSYADALACYRSPEYAVARDLRRAASEGEVIIVEGYDGPQPGA